MKQKKQRIQVIMGGQSSEHEVSLASGKEVMANLNPKKYDVSQLVINKNGVGWERLDKKSTVFLALHGQMGEDGTVQGMLELLGVKYTGSGVLASALATDKLKFREFIEPKGVIIPKYISISKNDDLKKTIKTLFRGPYFVKPHNQGSSVGVSIVEHKEELEDAVKFAWMFSDIALIDKQINGVEITCPIIGNENPIALPLVEIIPKGKFFDFNSKYKEGQAEEIVPARLDETVTKNIQNIGINVYKMLGCKGFGRVDFILSKQNIPVVLEINTIPGLTPTSLFPKSAKVYGLSYSDLLDKIISYAR